MRKKATILSLATVGIISFLCLGNYELANAGGPTSCNIGCGPLVPTGGTCASGSPAMVCEGDPQGTGTCDGDPCNNWNCSLCGSAADGGPYESAPTDNLCGWANNLVGSVTSDGTNWNWQCQEAPIGSPIINCWAPVYTAPPSPVDGVCGEANGGNYSTAPTTSLCSVGTASAVVETEGLDAWSWSCSGSNGGNNASCQANKIVSAACGTNSRSFQANDTDWPSSTSFCATGVSTPIHPAFPAQGGTTSWTCAGINSGANVNCQATRASASVEPKDEPDECKGEIGNYVWLDSNGDGKQDSNEKGISEVHIKLSFKNRSTTYHTHTNNKGHYSFRKLCKGDYIVTVKDEDVSGYIQTYDPDGNKNNKTDATLKNNHDSDMDNDFGYKGRRIAPMTGSGNMGIYIALLLALAALITYKKIRNKN